ncbi:MAG: HXXEE domain-containing protein [Bacteroidales bacterium]|nr:HXXEE domain-containing protein [Bacteroidales bacterium]
MKPFRFFSRYWAAIGGVLFVGLAFVVGIWGPQIPTLQRYMVLFYMALLFHQFEEYVFPGGFPAAANKGLFGEKDALNVYPLNEMSATTVNVFCAYPLYIVGIFCYRWIWYDIFIAYFTMAQLPVHCFKMNKALKSWYCPGCFSALFVMFPLGVYFLVQLAAAETFPSFYWWAPICAFPLVAFLTILLPILSFRRKDTPYAFAKYQDEEFEVRHGIASLFRKEK